MYKIISIMFLSAMIYITVPASKSEARMICTPKDWQGNQTCTDSSGGSITKERPDWQGNDIYRDNKSGKISRCKKDWQGNYVCD